MQPLQAWAPISAALLRRGPTEIEYRPHVTDDEVNNRRHRHSWWRRLLLGDKLNQPVNVLVRQRPALWHRSQSGIGLGGTSVLREKSQGLPSIKTLSLIESPGELCQGGDINLRHGYLHGEHSGLSRQDQPH